MKSGTLGFLFDRPEFIVAQINAIKQSVAISTLFEDSFPISFRVVDNCWLLPCGSPYGWVPIESIEKMIEEAVLRRVTSIRLTLYPIIYSPTIDCYVQRIKECGFEERKSEIVSFWPIDLQRSFESIIISAEKRRLRKGIREGLFFKIGEDVSANTYWELLSQFREQHNYSISIRYEQLLALLSMGKELVKVATVSYQEQTVSIALILHISSDIMYVFLPANDLKWKHVSPSVLLYKGIYEYARVNGIKIVDLGKNLDEEGFFKESLHTFKSRIGSCDTTSTTFEILLGF